MSDGAYLKEELDKLVLSDISIFEFIKAGSLDGVWYWDLEHPENEWMSERFWEVMGYGASDKKHLASEWQDMIFPEDLEVAVDNFNKHLANPDHPYDQIVRYRHKDGSTVWVRCRGIAIRDENGKPIRMLGAHNDLTQIMRAKQEIETLNKELEQEVSKDFLTKLLNRRGFEAHYHEIIEMAKRNGHQISCAMFDLDHFKEINDAYGHSEGDRVLKHIAHILVDIGRKSDIIGRYGGEEFIFLMPPRTDKEEATIAAERIRLSIQNQPLEDIGTVTISAGVATTLPSPDENTEAIAIRLRNQADTALYYAKEHGRNRVVHFDDIS
jgi:diguanylate cyclase (GGDEF)-like protein/PAS domain S-box-containing protein